MERGKGIRLCSVIGHVVNVLSYICYFDDSLFVVAVLGNFL